MSLDLILIRHAEASFGGPLGKDADRKLNERGRMSAKIIGTWLAQNPPECACDVLLSDARRTVETWAWIDPMLDVDCTVRASEALYLAPDLFILAEIHKATHPTVIVVGHNPGIADLAAYLCKQPPENMDFAAYPPASVTHLRFSGDDWSGVSEDQGHLVDFVTPGIIANRTG